MKKIQRSILILFNQCISIVLAVLGLSCSGPKMSTTNTNQPTPTPSSNNRPTNTATMIAMYGVPYTTYQINGKVEGNKGKAVPGIEVKAINTNTATITDNQGLFTLSGRNSFNPDTIYISVRDIDGKKNGEYQHDTVGVNVSYQENTNRQAWLMGTTNKEDVKIVLKQKQ